MSDKRIPRSVRINGETYEVQSGWAGTLNLAKWMGPIEYTAREPYAHIQNLYFVYDKNGSQVGEFDANHGSCRGCVDSISM